MSAAVTPLSRAVEEHLNWLAVHGYADTTLRARRYHLDQLAAFLADLDTTTPEAVSFAALESYQRHLHRHRTPAPASRCRSGPRRAPDPGQDVLRLADQPRPHPARPGGRADPAQDRTPTPRSDPVHWGG
ncbi:MAG TPA: hypothetical protein VMH41_13650 [Mycobacteriales bacterium]|nr:hypothetical protein [Mycobacteriales bacterium]